MLNIDQGIVRKAWRTFSAPLPCNAKDIADLYRVSSDAWQADHRGQSIYDDSIEVVVEGDPGDDHRVVFQYEINE